MLRPIVGVGLAAVLILAVRAECGEKTDTLRYGWKAGETYLYSVRIEAKLDSGTIVLTSLNNYGCVKADRDGFWLRQRNNLIARKEDPDGKSTPTILRSGLTAAARTNDIRIDAFGNVLKSSGESQLPFVLGNLSMLAIVPFSTEGKTTWEVKSDCIVRESAPAKPVNPRLKKMFPAPKVTPMPTTNDYPALETFTFTLVKRDGNLAVINKKYVLKTRHEENGKPYLEFHGEGPITFDVKAGVPRALEFKGVLKWASRAQEPIAVSFKLLEGEELAAALKIPQPPELKVGEATSIPQGGDQKRGDGKTPEWTLDLAKMNYPDGPVGGKMLGQDFRPTTAKREASGAIVLSQGQGFFPDAAIYIFLKPNEPIEGKTYEIRKDTPATERPPIHLKRVAPGQKLPTGPGIILGYAMKLECGKPQNGAVPCRLYVCLPDDGRSVVAGTFSLKVQ
jgi:hypothetical protein